MARSSATPKQLLHKWVEEKESTWERGNIVKDFRKEQGIPYGRWLSPNAFGNPLQWQVLDVLGVEAKPFETYTKLLFERGYDVEKKILSILGGQQQTFVSLGKICGFCDVILDTKDWDIPLGVIPFDIKSIGGMKMKRIKSAKGADMKAILQTCFYAMALGKDDFGVIYVNADAYDIETFTYRTKDVEPLVLNEIKQFEEAMNKCEVPVFEAKEAWQKNAKYNNFKDWMDLSKEECQKKLAESGKIFM